ncbi:MAG: DUF2085 domain-containing protein [Thermoplasmata archaeon]
MVTFESLLMFLGSTICHQIPERSYSFQGFQMPLCARCIGIHFGFIISSMFFLASSKRFSLGLPGKKQMIALGVIMSFVLIDAGLSYSGLDTSNNLSRTLSGLALGVPLPFILYPLLNTVLFRGGKRSNVLGKPLDWACLAGLYGLGALIILSAESFGPLFYAVSAVGVIGVFVFFTALFSVLVGLMLEQRPLSSSTKILGAAVLAFAFLMVLAAVHKAFFTNI